MISTSKLKAVDFYRKIPRDLTEASLSGAGLSIIAALSIMFLFGMELNDYLTVSTSTSVVVDKSADGEFLRIDFNISFPALSCEFASVDVSDILGTNRLNITKTVRKFSIDPNLKSTGSEFHSGPIPLVNNHGDEIEEEYGDSSEGSVKLTGHNFDHYSHQNHHGRRQRRFCERNMILKEMAEFCWERLIAQKKVNYAGGTIFRGTLLSEFSGKEVILGVVTMAGLDSGSDNGEEEGSEEEDEVDVCEDDDEDSGVEGDEDRFEECIRRPCVRYHGGEEGGGGGEVEGRDLWDRGAEGGAALAAAHPRFILLGLAVADIAWAGGAAGEGAQPDDGGVTDDGLGWLYSKHFRGNWSGGSPF